MVGLIGLVIFAAIQEAVVFASAFAGRRIIGAETRSSRVVAIDLSYIGWAVITIGGYSAIGGDGGLMDGFGFVLVLCFTALISSVAYTVAWLARA